MTLELDLLVATNQYVLLFKLLTFWGVLLTETCYCSRLYGRSDILENSCNVELWKHEINFTIIIVNSTAAFCFSERKNPTKKLKNTKDTVKYNIGSRLHFLVFIFFRSEFWHRKRLQQNFWRIPKWFQSLLRLQFFKNSSYNSERNSAQKSSRLCMQ